MINMVFATIIGLIVLIGITFLYLNDKLETLKEKNNISKASLKKLNLLKTIIFLLSCAVVIFFWLFVIKDAEKIILISIVLLFIDIIFIIIFRVKYLRYIRKHKKVKKN
ncbi:MAG: hypothetical protein ACRDAU_15380 [Clostridium sp.]